MSDLQRRVAALIAALPEADGFALAGGAALIARGDVDRLTRDLDFFGLSGDAVDRLLPAVEAALGDDGLAVVRVQVATGFARLAVSSPDERTEVDLASDARLFPVDDREAVPMLSREELAVDKLLAVFGRAEARDFVDLWALEPVFGLERLCGLAVKKDGGFDGGVLLEMLHRFDRLREEEFGLGRGGYAELRSVVRGWREKVVAFGGR